MDFKKAFIVLTILLCGATAVSVALRKQAEPRRVPANVQSSGDVSSGPSGANVDASLLAASRSLLLTGVSSVVPEARDIPVIRKIPLEFAEVNSLYHRAGNIASCEMLPASVTAIQPLTAAIGGTKGPLGRLSIASVGLRVDPIAEARLPRTTRNAIKDYLANHMAIVQGVLYHAEDGLPFFAPRARAAFVDRSDPVNTIEAERMIQAAIGEFRMLGVYQSESEPDAKTGPGDARVTFMAFRYHLDEKNRISSAEAVREYELLLVHRDLNTGDPLALPTYSVFATSDARRNISLLESISENGSIGDPVVVANVRFDDFTMLGLYPANPVVTGVVHRSLLTIPVSSLKSMLDGVGTPESVRQLPDVLDELVRRAKEQSSEEISKGSGEATEPAK